MQHTTAGEKKISRLTTVFKQTCDRQKPLPVLSYYHRYFSIRFGEKKKYNKLKGLFGNRDRRDKVSFRVSNVHVVMMKKKKGTMRSNERVFFELRLSITHMCLYFFFPLDGVVSIDELAVITGREKILSAPQ